MIAWKTRGMLEPKLGNLLQSLLLSIHYRAVRSCRCHHRLWSRQRQFSCSLQSKCPQLCLNPLRLFLSPHPLPQSTTMLSQCQTKT